MIGANLAPGAIIDSVPRQPKSPQEKKELAYTRDHFTGGYNSTRKFVKNWKRKKVRFNREFRRKADRSLLQAKPGTPSGDLEVISGEVTVDGLQKSTLRKRLKKAGTVTVGEKVRGTMERRQEMAGRRVRQKEAQDERFAETVATLRTLDDEKLAEILVQAFRQRKHWSPEEFSRICSSQDPAERAVWFLFQSEGSAPEHAAVCRNDELRSELQSMIERVNRLLARQRRPIARKQIEMQTLKAKLRSARTGSVG